MQASTGSLSPLKDGSGSSGRAYNLRKNIDHDSEFKSFKYYSHIEFFLLCTNL